MHPDWPFICPECGASVATKGLYLSKVYPPVSEDPWAIVLQQVTCGSCHWTIPRIWPIVGIWLSTKHRPSGVRSTATRVRISPKRLFVATSALTTTAARLARSTAAAYSQPTALPRQAPR